MLNGNNGCTFFATKLQFSMLNWRFVAKLHMLHGRIIFTGHTVRLQSFTFDSEASNCEGDSSRLKILKTYSFYEHEQPVHLLESCHFFSIPHPFKPIPWRR